MKFLGALFFILLNTVHTILYCSNEPEVYTVLYDRINKKMVALDKSKIHKEEDIMYGTFDYYLADNDYSSGTKFLSTLLKDNNIQDKETHSHSFLIYLIKDCLKKSTNENHLNLLNIIKKQHPSAFGPVFIKSIASDFSKTNFLHHDLKFNYTKSAHDFQLVVEILEKTNYIEKTPLMKSFLTEFNNYQAKQNLQKQLETLTID